MNKLLYRVAEAAELLGVSRQEMYVLIGKGIVPSIRLGGRMVRVPREALEAVIAQAAERAASAESAKESERNECA